MRNFSVITIVRLALLKEENFLLYSTSKIKLSDILKIGYTFKTISDIKPHSCSFEENEKNSAAGTYFEKKLKFEISMLKPEVSELLNQYSEKQVMALITDANDYSQLVYPLIRTIKRKLPGTAKGANVTEITFSGSGIQESPFVEMNL